MGNHFHLVVETAQGSLVEGMRWLRDRQGKTEPPVAEELKNVEWAQDDMARRRHRDPAKWALAARLRRETTLTVKAIASRLHMGSPKSANARLWAWRAAQTAEGKAASSRQETARHRSR